MRLANRMLFVAAAVVVLSATALSQTLRPETDPRNISPTVGTGGTPGGPTGLFTIYDGDTLRKGEFTFSIAYSNWDRDPGNVDLTEVPLSFQIGINDHLELFFTTDGYRKVQAHNPQNLSGFYLPNTTINGCVGPAIILPPTVVTGGITTIGTVGAGGVFRPACNQPAVAFPFVGGTGPNFGLTGNIIAPPVTTRLGPVSGGDSGSRGAAALFAGIGSPAGSILPGIVLTTRTIPANLTFNPLTVPDTFTINPSYLPDAPFLGRLDDHSSFGTVNLGAKVRFTGPNNPLGVGLVGFWRWYMDTPNNADGFEQLQRGSSPGARPGDFGLVGFVSGRLSRSVNLSANFGYVFTTNPHSSAFGGGDVVLLDRPDEFHAGIGFDFPINKHFQIIAEAKSIRYVGTRTPNAFENDPFDVLGGIRVFARRNVGFSAWYRRHMNQQSSSSFNGTLPNGFVGSDDPNGFGFQFFAGRRNARTPSILPNQPPTASLAASASTITLPCPPGTHSKSGSCPAAATSSVNLTTTASDPDGDTLLYSYTVTGGRVTGEGANVAWDLSGMGPGTYTASVDVDDGCGCITSSTTTVTIASCSDCEPDLVCPTVNVTCPTEVDEGGSITFTANFTPGTPQVTPTYNWTVSAGTITSGQGTSSITVSTNNLGGQTVTATVEVGGVDPSCGRTATCSTPVKPKAVPARKFDEYGNIRFNDEKARLDNFAIQLQNEPTAQGYIIGYGSCDAEGQTRANRAKDYLVNTRGIDAGRIMVVDGGCMPELKVELWIVPQGATPPTPDTTGAVSPCPDCKKKPATRRRGRRGEE
jgi:hypothetical protein